MISLTQKDLLDAGVHFGHLTKKWHPNMAPFIFMKHSGIHIIDLNKTLYYLQEAAKKLQLIAHAGKKILFVATKKQAKECVEQEAKRLHMPYITERWLGGTLTNFVTIRKLLKRMESVEKMVQSTAYKNRTKKEQLMVMREKKKLNKLLQGIADMTKLPAALFVVDINKEHIAVKEAKKLGIPVFAFTDTNADPTLVDYPIPSNDDATRAINLIVKAVGSAMEEGIEAYKKDKITPTHQETAPTDPKIKPQKTTREANVVKVASTEGLEKSTILEKQDKKAIDSKLPQTTNKATKTESLPQAPEQATRAKTKPKLATQRQALLIKNSTMAITAQEVRKLREQTGAGMMDCKKALTEALGDFEQAIDILRKKGQKLATDRADRATTEGALFAKKNEANNEAVLIALSCETDFVAKNEAFQQLGQTILAAAFTYKPATIDALYQLAVKGVSIQENITAFVGKIGEKIAISAYETLRSEVVVPYIHTGNKLGVLVGLQGAHTASVVAAGRNVALQIAAMKPIAVDKEDVDPSIIARELAIAREQAKNEGKPPEMLEKIAQGKLHKFFQENTLLQQPFVKDNSCTIAQYLRSIAAGLTVTSFKRLVIGA